MIAKRKYLFLAILIVEVFTFYFIVVVLKRLHSEWKLKEWIILQQVDERDNNYNTTHHCDEMMLDQDQRQVRRNNLRRMIVNDEYKLLYCPIPKIACTNLRRVFLILAGTTNHTDPLKLTQHDVHFKYIEYLKRLHTYSSKQISYRLQHYRKIIFVREPFERLLSAYKDKFLRVNIAFRRTYGRTIIKTFRANASKESLKHGNDVTFGEFVQYLIQRHANKQRLNDHWTPYTKLCFPCQIQYDFIGRFETMDDDVGVLLESIGLSDTIQFPKRNETYNTTKTKDVLYQFYRNIDPDDLAKLQTIYASDSKLFDYKIPEEIRKLLGNKRL